MKKFYALYFILAALFNVQCSTMISPELKETIHIGGSKEVQIPVKPAETQQHRPFREPEPVDKTKMAARFKILTEQKITTASDFRNIEVYIKNANVGLLKKNNDKLWMYLEETRKFYDSGWYWYNPETNVVVKAIRTYFDIDLINELSPKYNKKEYFYFRKKEFDKIQLFKFDQSIFTWLTTTFMNEIGDTNISCITIDENTDELWFGLKNKVKKFDMKREIWSDPFRERNLSGLFNNSEINEIMVTDEYVWFILFDCTLVGYDKKQDIWRSWNPSEFSCGYLSFITEDEIYAWFKSDVGIKKFNKQNTRWYDFDEANYLSSKIIKNVTVDESGDIWIETFDEIARHKKSNNSWEILRKSNFPARNRSGENYLETINSLTVDGSFVWITTTTGLLLFNTDQNFWIIHDKKDINDRFRTDLTTFNIVYSDNNFIWIGTNDGLFRLIKPREQ